MDFRPSVRPQDTRSRAGMTWKGRRRPIASQWAACGSWGLSASRSRTSPKPPFQNPSIAGSACVSAVWDSGVAEKRDPGIGPGDGLRRWASGLTDIASGRHAAGGAPRWRLPRIVTPRFRGKSRDSGMLVWALARPPTAPARSLTRPRPPLRPPDVSAANAGTSACSYGRPPRQRTGAAPATATATRKPNQPTARSTGQHA